MRTVEDAIAAEHLGRDREDTFRVIATADLHLSNTLPHSRPMGHGGAAAHMTDRLQDQMKVLGQLRDHAHDVRADAVFVLGDIFDKRLLDAVTLRAAADMFQSFAPTPVYLLPGNHDAHTIRGERFNAEIFGAMGADHLHFWGDAKGHHLRPRPWLKFFALPFMPTTDFMERADAMKASFEPRGSSGQNVLLMHEPVVGCKHLAWSCDAGLDADTLTDGWDMVLSGHFHTSQRFGSSGMYLGAPMPLHFGDVGEVRAFWDFTFTESAEVHAKACQPACPKFVVFEYDHSEDSPDDTLTADFIHNACDLTDDEYLRVIVRATHPEWGVVQPYVRIMKQELENQGIRVLVQHKPVQTHAERLSCGPGGSPALEALLGQYIDLADTVTLDRARLAKIGADALATAKAMR